MPFQPIASSDNYIQLNKKITNKQIINEVKILQEATMLSPTEVCYKLILDGAIAAKEKRLKYEKLLKEGAGK